MYLLVICIASFEKSLFSSFVHIHTKNSLTGILIYVCALLYKSYTSVGKYVKTNEASVIFH
jgi:hypothetical protein